MFDMAVLERICGTTRLVAGQKTFIMGILNVTKESFSDGGCYINTHDAVEHGLRMMHDGADIIDVGGVSTAPHVPMISEQEELDRIMPVVERLVQAGISALSIDTMRASVAEQALALGASWINDQSAGWFDEKMPAIMAKADAVVLMHNGGGASSGVVAGEAVHYHDVVSEVSEFFQMRIKQLGHVGILANTIIIDPGIGFGKGLHDTCKLITGLTPLLEMDAMILMGVSRKSAVGKLSDIANPADRDWASLAAAAKAVQAGAHIVRTHNVKASVEFFRVWDRLSAFSQGLMNS